VGIKMKNKAWLIVMVLVTVLEMDYVLPVIYLVSRSKNIAISKIVRINPHYFCFCLEYNRIV